MKNDLITPESALEINVTDATVLGSNGENLPENELNFRPFVEETLAETKWTKAKFKIVEFLKTLPAACSYACHR